MPRLRRFITTALLLACWEASAAPQPLGVNKVNWETAQGGYEAARPIIKARLNSWPGVTLTDPHALPAGDTQPFLWRLARDTWRGLDAMTDREYGLPVNHIGLGNDSPALDRIQIGDYTNITDVGLYLIGVIAAYDLRLADTATVLERLGKTLTSLEKLERYQGFFYNYYDTVSLEHTSHMISFVDSAWLVAGLIVVRNTFPELNERCSRLIDQQNFRFFYDAATQQMRHGYYADSGTMSPYHYGILFAESRIGSMIAIAKGDVPEQHWFKMVRTYPAHYEWQTQAPQNRVSKRVGEYDVEDGHYQWRDYKYIPSWGGSMFEALMPALVMDEAQYAPHSLGANGRIHSEVQRDYALQELRYPVWGMSPSWVPGADNYAEFGVRALGVRGYPSDVVTPHASILALLTLPDAALNNLRQLLERYPIYGDFGFYDAVNPNTGKVAYKYLSLDQAMILVALANYLQDHAIQKRFAADPLIQKVLPLLQLEKFFE